MRGIRLAIGATALAVSLISCTSAIKMGLEEATGQKTDVEVIRPISADLKAYRRVEVEQFTSGIGGLVPEALVDGLRGMAIAKIREGGLFPSVGPATAGKAAEPTLLVGGAVTDYKKPVEGAKRLISKDSLFSVNVSVRDKGTGEEIGRAIARGRLVTMFRGDEATLMEKAAESVAKFIGEAHTPTPGRMERIKGMFE
ncbi:MAG: hypothetical protein PHN82_01275 [bacterium]|nr:hypothetical protein [bacterium]